MNKRKIGVIADDFTGASDAASFLAKSGNRTVLLTKLPQTLQSDCHCIVVALKIRSVPADQAIAEIEKVIQFFEKNHVEQYYYKYCSTFDSTPKGNIGPVMDYLLERMHQPYTLLCPSLPINGRTVKDGILKVNGIPLAESSMKNHPLNPMWDSYIPNLMKEQSKYPCFPLSSEIMKSKEKLSAFIEQLKVHAHFYLVPDYTSDQEGALIHERFAQLPVLSGGSGLLAHFKQDTSQKQDFAFDQRTQKAMIVCGSCSEMTRKQVQYFKTVRKNAYTSHSQALLDHSIDAQKYARLLEEQLPNVCLVYSDGCETTLKTTSETFLLESQLMEQFLSELALLAKNSGFNKIIAAGGETSGAVMLRLGYSSFFVGDSVSPGVPVLIPVEDTNMRIILKSGNFGDEAFFLRAIEAK